MEYLARILKHKLVIIRLLWGLYALWFLILIGTIIISRANQYWLVLGRFSGNVSVIFLCATLLPGIIKRFNFKNALFQQFKLILLSFRRQLGIGMFVSALAHNLWVKILPTVKFKLPIFPPQLFEVFGMLALYAALLLFLTSNDFSVKKLGKKWNKLHQLVYFIVWLVLIHIVLVKGMSLVSIVILILATIETTSIIYGKAYIGKISQSLKQS